MSLAQHVASTEGADREWLEPLIEPEHVLRRVLSFDPLPPRLVEDQADHIAAYKVSKPKRAGEGIAEGLETEIPLTICSPNSYHCPCVLACFGNCLWLCCSEACPDLGRGLSRTMHG